MNVEKLLLEIIDLWKEQIALLKEQVALLKVQIAESHGNRELLSIKDAAQYFGVSERSIRRLIGLGAVLTVKFPGIEMRISRKSLDEYASKEFEGEKELIKYRTNFVYECIMVNMEIKKMRMET